MRLFQLILNNVPPQTIAQEFFQAVSRSNEADISITIKHFLHSIMDAIGFNYYVTINEVTETLFRWPENRAKGYVFNYERAKFDRYCLFLKETCTLMDREGCQEALVKIVEMFLGLSASMDTSWEARFKEPFSLLSLTLLRSMFPIRKASPDTEATSNLDAVCGRLFEISRKGLGFRNSHQIILRGLSGILAKDYHYFLYINEDVFQFYINCMEFEFPASRGQFFIFMKNAIDNSRIPDEARVKLITFLTDCKMIKSYCVFAQHLSPNSVGSLLKFLNSLLSCLPVLECFSRDQIHMIFSNALQKRENVRSLAVQFYLTFMRKSFPDKWILRDILDFCLTKAGGTKTLDAFFDSLWNEFPYMTTFDPYLRILRKPELSTLKLSVPAHFIVRVFKNLYNECETNDAHALVLSEFLLKLPSVLETMQDKWQVRGILLEVYSITDPKVAIVTIKDFPIAANRFTAYAINYLKQYDEELPIVQNTSYHMLQLMEFFNMYEEMQLFADDVYGICKEFMANPSALSDTQVRSLQHGLVLLSNITDTSSALSELNLINLVTDLGVWLFNSTTLQELSSLHNCYLETFAVKAYSGCLSVFSAICAKITPDESNIESKMLLLKTQPFLKYLLNRLKDEDQSKMTLPYVEAAMRALFDLYIVFNFKLERDVYHTMVNCVNKHVFGEAVHSNDSALRQLELQRNILYSFGQLHKVVEIPTAITWKVVIHFGLAANFETELSELLDALFEHNSKKFKSPLLFTYVVPVAIFNLFQQRTRLQRFQKALNAYKRYVEAKVPDGTQRVMKMHIVLTMVDMIERAMKAGDIQQQSNRVELLANMNVFLTDIFRNDSDLILQQSRRLEKQSLTREELYTLNSFQKQLSQ